MLQRKKQTPTALGLSTAGTYLEKRSLLIQHFTSTKIQVLYKAAHMFLPQFPRQTPAVQRPDTAHETEVGWKGSSPGCRPNC